MKNNILLKFFLAVLLSAFSSLTMHAQTDAMDADFVEAVKAYAQSAPSTIVGQKDQLLKVLAELNKAIAPELDDDNSQRYIEEYLDKQLVDDIAEKLLAKGLVGLVATDDLKTLTTLMQTPEGKEMQQNMSKMNKAVSAAWEDFGRMIALQLMAGNDPEPLEKNSKIPESYEELFKKYYAKSETAAITSNLLQGLKPILSKTGSGGLADKLSRYFDENMPVLCLNSWFEVMSEDDLRFALKMSDMPAYKSVMEASKNMMRNLPQTGMTIVQSYVDWLQGKGVDVTM